MKALKCVLVLFSFVGLMLVGCSDQSQSPVSADDQSAALLQKKVLHYFTGVDFPIAPPEGGEIRDIPGGKIQFKKVKVTERFVSDDPRVAGTMVHYLSTMIDAETGAGRVHGSFTLTPDAYPDTKWVGTYEGDRVYNGKTFVDILDFLEPLTPGDGTYDNWTLTLKLEGHGKGGDIDGMQMFSDNILTIMNYGLNPSDPKYVPFPRPQFWFGIGNGFYK